MNYSDIPNVNALLALPALENISSTWARRWLVTVQEVRRQIAEGTIDHVWTLDDWNKALNNTIEQHQQLRYRPVINATGIVVHTNLGRAPLAQEVVSYMTTVSQYTDLELRLKDGKRGGRLEGIRRVCAMRVQKMLWW